ncbi:MAG: hypothetical protein AVDCRST_MAG43-1344 [uncultured Thermomicrobiales bacterium]|uniref:Uncharacterized protein n=1 Tax=uncultured Thermomicrobiales bacterium TaxID=1645740 RepID=A0A6J4UM10_9BACT|nr:MAG: hypothetical protein AVDCRST_MAG43-1344 [uncultured Thermomicrobiales bacterium]
MNGPLPVKGDGATIKGPHSLDHCVIVYERMQPLKCSALALGSSIRCADLVGVIPVVTRDNAV